MRIALLVFISFTLTISHAFSQSAPLIKITEIDPNLPPPNQDQIIKNWVLNTLHGGGGIIDTNTISFSKGNPAQIGKFEFGGPSIALDSGLVISTGKVIQIQSYNDRYDNTFNFNGPQDPDLDKMTEEVLGVSLFPPIPKAKTGDAAVLEFEYKPYGEQIVLTYVFGSEEYYYQVGFDPVPGDVDLTDPPYDLERMYDVFGISIDRPSRPFSNIAVLQPGGTVDVSINSVNDHTNDVFYQANPGASTGASKGIQFDGFTKPENNILIRKNVTPCLNYKIKIAIQDFLMPDPENPQEKGYHYNSGIFLGGGSLIGGADVPPWTVDYKYTHPSSLFEGKLIEGGCNDLLVTFTLSYETSSSDPYYIPFKIESDIYKNNVVITDTATGNIITIDSVTFENGEIQKTIRLSAVNISADIPFVRFTYPLDPCERPIPPWNGGVYSGKVEFAMINNEPFSFSADPKVYSAYCKETINLTVVDITSGGVDPVSYIWPDNPIPPVDVYPYTVNASPDFVPVIVTDLCDNEGTVQIQINNKPIQLKGIQSIFLCGPGQEATVPVTTIIPNPTDMPGYSIDHVVWQRQTPPPIVPLGDQDGNDITVVYDDVVGDAIWTCWYEATDVCGGKADSVFTVNQSSLVLENTGICNGTTIELTTGTPAHWYKWYRQDGTNWTLVGEDQTTYDNSYPSNQSEIVYKLEIEDNCGEFQEAEMSVFVDIYEPAVSYSPKNELCMGDGITIEANESQSSTVSYTWYLGSDVVGTGRILTLDQTDYQVPGTYTYTLETVSQSTYFFCTKSIEAEFTVHANPSSAFTIDPPDNACTNTDVQFDYNGDISSKTFLWDFGDGSTSTQPSTNHQYGTPGDYTIYLGIDLTYPTGHVCSSDSSTVLTVDPLPSPEFSVDVNEGCLPVAVQFTDNSQDIYPGATYEWTFGDGSQSDLKNPSYVYNQAGWYSVGLTIYNTARCFASVSKPNLIQVNPNPLADFEADPWITTMDDPEISFYNISESDSTLIDFDWEFGDGSSSGDENPVHEYEQAGDYEILMRVETENGCWDTIIGKVAVTEFVKLYIPSAFTPNGDGLNDCFQIKGTPVTDWNLYIYDRWGGIIWSTHNFETLWCGTDYSGNPVEPGTYIYQISGSDYKLEPVSFKGTVTVIR